MITARTAEEIREVVDGYRRAGERVAFVPTMGALHEGHLSLVRRGQELADRVVVSIFVNPTQFNQSDDLDRYPRTPERDAALLEEIGADALFVPVERTLYPSGAEHETTWVVPEGPAEGLEGAFRPGHFRGVATVVLKLLNLVRPDVAVFGEKDAQQLAVVERMVRDLLLGVEIVPGPTVREDDGLALSSRNARLSGEEREAARVLHSALRKAEEAIHRLREEPGGSAGEDVDEVRRVLREALGEEPAARIDYAEVVDAATFRPADSLAGDVVVPIAVWIGTTRLIDNVRVAAG